MKYRVIDKKTNQQCDDITVNQDGSLSCDNGTTLFLKDDFQVTWEPEVDDVFSTPKGKIFILQQKIHADEQGEKIWVQL